MHCAQGSMSQSEIDHALKQFIFECIQVSKNIKRFCGLFFTENFEINYSSWKKSMILDWLTNQRILPTIRTSWFPGTIPTHSPSSNRVLFKWKRLNRIRTRVDRLSRAPDPVRWQLPGESWRRPGLRGRLQQPAAKEHPVWITIYKFLPNVSRKSTM